jgi:hypothetical protein
MAGLVSHVAEGNALYREKWQNIACRIASANVGLQFGVASLVAIHKVVQRTCIAIVSH